MIFITGTPPKSLGAMQSLAMTTPSFFGFFGLGEGTSLFSPLPSDFEERLLLDMRSTELCNLNRSGTLRRATVGSIPEMEIPTQRARRHSRIQCILYLLVGDDSNLGLRIRFRDT